jgi:hypothetical protein
MSANLKPDLEQIKRAFENFRAGRTGKERLPENLWAQAITLLEHYPLRVVCRELHLKPDYLRRRSAANKGIAVPAIKNKSKSQFLTLTSSELTAIKNEVGAASVPSVQSINSQCRLIIERSDGSRLTLNLPIDWPRIETLCSSFLRG